MTEQTTDAMQDQFIDELTIPEDESTSKPLLTGTTIQYLHDDADSILSSSPQHIRERADTLVSDAFTCLLSDPRDTAIQQKIPPEAQEKERDWLETVFYRNPDGTAERYTVENLIEYRMVFGTQDPIINPNSAALDVIRMNIEMDRRLYDKLMHRAIGALFYPQNASEFLLQDSEVDEVLSYFENQDTPFRDDPYDLIALQLLRPGLIQKLSFYKDACNKLQKTINTYEPRLGIEEGVLGEFQNAAIHLALLRADGLIITDKGLELMGQEAPVTQHIPNPPEEFA